MIKNLLYRSIRRVWTTGYLGASRLGERIGWDCLTYNWGITYSLHRMARRDAPIFVSDLLDVLPGVTSVADVGCGSGVYSAELQSRGLKVVGCEYGARPLRWAKLLGVNAVPFDLSKSGSSLPGRPYDLAISLEVAEHVPPVFADRFVDFMCETSDRIILTAAVPGQGGYGHVNEQPKEYWIEKFEKRGLSLNATTTDVLARRLQGHGVSRYLYQNIMCLDKNVV
jgi:SAM-dependent methyltransferase